MLLESFKIYLANIYYLLNLLYYFMDHSLIFIFIILNMYTMWSNT